VLVENVTLTNQPCWGCFLHGCEYVTVRGMQTRNPYSYFNSDGIDIDSCRYVTVSDCIIDTGDDAIAIRGSDTRLKNKPHPCEYITISNCVLGSSSCSIRIGVGNSIIRHLRITNLTITRGAPAICLMSTYNRHGHVSIEDVSITNVSAMNCTRALDIVEEAGVPIRNITLENFTLEIYGYFHLRSEYPDSVSNITLRNWDVTMIEGPQPVREKDYLRRGTVWFRASNIKGLKLENFAVHDPDGHIPEIWKDGEFLFEGCEDRLLTNVTVNA